MPVNLACYHNAFQANWLDYAPRLWKEKVAIEVKGIAIGHSCNKVADLPGARGVLSVDHFCPPYLINRQGSFSLQEVEYAAGCGGILVSMGPFVLKSDTAAIVGTGFVRLYYAC